MKQQTGRQIWIVLVVLALAVLACGGGAEATATAIPHPTQKPNATATKPAPKPTATKASAKPTAKVTATPGDAVPIVLSDTPYVHKSGGFTVSLPQDWETDEKDNSVFVSSPDKVVASAHLMFLIPAIRSWKRRCSSRDSRATSGGRRSASSRSPRGRSPMRSPRPGSGHGTVPAPLPCAHAPSSGASSRPRGREPHRRRGSALRCRCAP